MDYNLITSNLQPDGLFILNLISSNECDLNEHFKTDDYQTINGHFASIRTYDLINACRLVVACELVPNDFDANFLQFLNGKIDIDLKDLYSYIDSGVKR